MRGFLPYQESARMGYRLLTEFFTFPAKFQFVELRRRTGSYGRRLLWSQLAARSFGRKCEIVIFCNKTLKSLEQGVDAETFRLKLRTDREPVRKECRADSRIAAPDRIPHRAGSHESPDDGGVRGHQRQQQPDPTENRSTQYPPFYGLEHSQGTRAATRFSGTRRGGAPWRRTIRASDVYLSSLVNLHFESRAGPRTIC